MTKAHDPHGIRALRSNSLRPDVPLPPKVSIRVVRALLEIVERCCTASPRALLHALGLDDSRCAQDDLLPRSTGYRICELAIAHAHTHDPAIGLHWTHRQRHDAFSLLSHVIAHAPTLRHALEALSELHPLFSQTMSFQIKEDFNKVTLLSDGARGASLIVQRFIAETMIAGLNRIVLSFDSRAHMQVVSFEHAAPDYLEEYVHVFQGTVHFEQPFTGLVFDRSLLKTPSRHQDAEVFSALISVARTRIVQRSLREPLWQRVHDFIEQHATSDPDHLAMPVVARVFDMSPRTLRRRLKAEGKPYPKLLSDARCAAAKELLADDQRTLKEAAAMLGFARPEGFHRAFKRWTGITPTDYRVFRCSQEAAAAWETKSTAPSAGASTAR